jgi:hypothetical protein
VNLELRRRPSSTHATIGELFEADALQCFTLEDVVRERPGVPVGEWKIPGKTAIPAGRYKITVTHSQRFGRDLPLLNAVPGFLGVRIHPGNTAADTEGCILVGTQMAGEAIVESRKAFEELFADIRGALDSGEEVWITVLNLGQAAA